MAVRKSILKPLTGVNVGKGLMAATPSFSPSSGLPTIGKSLLPQVQKAGAAPAAAGAPAAPAAPNPYAHADSTFFNSVAQNFANRDYQVAGLQRDNTNDNNNRLDYLGKLAKQLMDTNTGLSGNAAKAGLADSGTLVGQKDQAKATSTELGSDATKAFLQREAGRTADIGQLQKLYGQQGVNNQYGMPDAGLNGLGLLGESEDRFRANQTASGVPAATAPKGSGNPAFPLVNAAGDAYKSTKDAQGRTVHVYANGKKVVVK